MSRMMSSSGFLCIEGDFPSPIHFWEEERKQDESDRRIIGFLSCFLLASSSARHACREFFVCVSHRLLLRLLPG